ncbi:hypothetical protein [Vibrio viridaestus]|uniref:Uncharacterized protein n=1 Tax=Vibrio viridaestus TaxID=2487322 RepID=A0A3N9TGY9_9VIBR|nr:hypothetical protein [Vibrio viridaestus]RQW63548.1 hypothetical protein EES38_09890 [Vibrio viridaestus]
MINVGKHDAITLKITHAMPETKACDLDIFLFVPGEIGLSRNIIDESEFYYNCFTQKRTYFSDKILLPLIHSRLAQRGRLSTTQYRVSLSLFAYQYVIALDKAIHDLTKHGDSITEDEIDSVIELSLDILRRLRRTIPYEENIKRYYNNIDNYLSWYTEQSFLSLVSTLPRNDDYTTIKNRLITLAEKEEAHRTLNHYNSKKASENVNRLTNKMRLLRRLIEHPVVLKQEMSSLGKNISRAVKGIATGFIMVFVTITAVMARDYLGEITASFIVVMSLLYALREIFKDDLKELLWRWLRKGKPKWKRRYNDPTTGSQVGHKVEWLDYKTLAELPDRIKFIRKKRVVQREERIVHYRSETQMSTSKFLSGYEETRETIHIDFRPLTRLFDKSATSIYILNNGQVSKEKVEKRHLLNLIIKENNHKGVPNYYRYKVVLSRNKIVDIEKIELTP